MPTAALLLAPLLHVYVPTARHASPTAVRLQQHMAERLHKLHKLPPEAVMGRLKFSSGGETWVVDTHKLTVTPCKRGVCHESDVQADVDPDTLTALLARRISPFKAIMQRKLRLEGDTSLLRRMGWLWDCWLLDGGASRRGGAITWTARALRWAVVRAPQHLALVPRRVGKCAARGTLRAMRWAAGRPRLMIAHSA